MAKPIEKTPVLQGKDAKAFFDNLLLLAKQTPASRKKKEARTKRMKQSYNAFLTISDGVL